MIASAVKLIERLTADETFRRLVARLREGKGPACVEGSWGSFAPLVAGFAAAESGRPLLYVTAHLEEADDARDDLELFLQHPVEVFGAWEALPGEGAAADEIAAERLRLCSQLREIRDVGFRGPGSGVRGRHGGERKASRIPPPHPPLMKGRRRASDRATGAGSAAPDARPGTRNPEPGTRSPETGTRSPETGTRNPLIIVAPIQALMQPVPSFEALEANSLAMTTGDERDPQAIAAWLVDQGFTRLDLVESPGDFALRGGILDIYPFGHIDPVRVEFFGNRIESIRQFDVSTQRSMRDLGSIRIASPKPLTATTEREAPASAPAADGRTTSFLSYLPPEAIIAFDGPVEIQEVGRTFLDRLGRPVGMFPVEAVFRRANGFTQLHLARFGAGGEAADTFRFDVQSVQRFEAKAAEAVAELCALTREYDVIVYCDNAGEQQRLRELIAGDASRPPDPERIRLEIGLLHRGFCWTTARLIVVGDHEIFHRY
ncbi:MAG TPA: hypothetical protein PLC79_08270, partial [Phycisphaerae bacterium]|nr:hypothetical protein [Phycisphaerae bacterium]